MMIRLLFVLFGACLISACGSSSGSGSKTFKVIDGPLENAEVWIDLNGNFQRDADEPTGLSNANGEVSFRRDVLSDDALIIVKAEAGTTVDSDHPDAPVQNTFYLIARGDNSVVSPFTTLHHYEQEANASSETEAISTLERKLNLNPEKFDLDYTAIDTAAAKKARLLAKSLVTHGTFDQPDNSNQTAQTAVHEAVSVASAVQSYVENSAPESIDYTLAMDANLYLVPIDSSGNLDTTDANNDGYPDNSPMANHAYQVTAGTLAGDPLTSNTAGAGSVAIPGQAIPDPTSHSAHYSPAQQPIKQNLPGSASHPSQETVNGHNLMAVLLLLKAESQQTGAVIRGGAFNNVKLQPEQLYPTSGSSMSKTVNIASSGIVYLNGTKNGREWRCIKTDGNVSVSRDQTGLSVNGTVEQYKFQLTGNTCTSTVIAAYRFNNLSLNDDLQITAGTLEVFDNSTAAGSPSATFDGAELLAEIKLQELGKLFGPAWADLQTPFIIDAINTAPSFLHLDRSSGVVSFDFNALQGYSSASFPINFNSLNKAQILAGTVFGGAPGGSAASTDWCRIVNIPHSGSEKDQQYQVVISTNCARSTERWCDSFGNVTGSTKAASPPVAWDAEVAASAMKNTVEQKRQNKQGHFVVEMAQNAFVLAAGQAIVPVFGYTQVRSDGKDNNAGANSWAGHPGHCQNVMNPGHKKVGVAWLMNDVKHLPSYWTQNFLDR